ncbi:hypothetical protein LX32DRAFT_683611 [Colletotrichum zoysiae]|uniref:Uncharacterized protein n=1 Tax=Colletotrichum zoysiae TaxID=1216348 RepID=A0AAD9HER1_9PEZI|nr:hypothetical protein LX32DRAFT_683611 [Colletotrichum zoysiae]
MHHDAAPLGSLPMIMGVWLIFRIPSLAMPSTVREIQGFDLARVGLLNKSSTSAPGRNRHHLSHTTRGYATLVRRSLGLTTACGIRVLPDGTWVPSSRNSSPPRTLDPKQPKLKFAKVIFPIAGRTDGKHKARLGQRIRPPRKDGVRQMPQQMKHEQTVVVAQVAVIGTASKVAGALPRAVAAPVGAAHADHAEEAPLEKNFAE